MRLCAGDDRAEDHHGIEVMGEAGRVLPRRRLPEGVAGIGQPRELVGRFMPAGCGAEVRAGIQTGRGPWVAALIAAGYVVFPVSPLQASRYRGRHGTSGAKSGGGDARMLAGAVRADADQLRPAAGDGPAAGAVKVLARTRQTLIWERAAVVRRLRARLLEYFPAAAAASGDLDAPGALELLGKAPDPARAARLTRAQVPAVLKRAGRYKIAERTEAILAALRSPQLGQPPALTAACAAAVRSPAAVTAALSEQAASLQGQVEAHFGRHRDAEIYLSQPGPGTITGARVPGEPGGDPYRCASAKARRNYAGTSPSTRASGKRQIAAARFIRDGRLTGALMIQAFAARRVSPGARAFCGAQRARGPEHNDALRRLASRLPGIPHGCPKTRTCYDEATAWGHREQIPQSDAAA